MTFSTRAELVGEIENRLNSPEAALHVDGFIRAAEADLNRKLRTRRRIARFVATLTDEFSAVPDDFGGARVMRLANGSGRQLVQLSEEQMAGMKDTATDAVVGEPQYFAIVGDEFEYHPIPPNDGEGFDVMLSYYQKLPALVLAADTNWILADHPDAYLAGALWHGYAFLGDAKAQYWRGEFDRIVAEINAAALSESMSGTMGVTPSGTVV